MKIKPHKSICEKYILIVGKEYEVLEISNLRGETPVDLSFKIKNELGEEVWVNDWDCEEIPRIDRFAFMQGKIRVDKTFEK